MRSWGHLTKQGWRLGTRRPGVVSDDEERNKGRVLRRRKKEVHGWEWALRAVCCPDRGGNDRRHLGDRKMLVPGWERLAGEERNRR